MSYLAFAIIHIDTRWTKSLPFLLISEKFCVVKGEEFLCVIKIEFKNGKGYISGFAFNPTRTINKWNPPPPIRNFKNIKLLCKIFLRLNDLMYVFQLFVWSICIHWQYKTSEDTGFFYSSNKTIQKLTLFLSSLNKNKLVFTYMSRIRTSLKKIFCSSRNRSMFSERPFCAKNLEMVLKVNFLMSYFKIWAFESKWKLGKLFTCISV